MIRALGLVSFLHGTGETGWNLLNRPSETAVEVWNKGVCLGTHLDQVFGALIKPILTDWDEGRSGEAIGRALFEIVGLVGTGGVLNALKSGKVSKFSFLNKVDDVGVVGALNKTEKLSEVGKVGKAASVLDNIFSSFDDIFTAIKNKLGYSDEASDLSRLRSTLKNSFVEGESVSSKAFLEALMKEGLTDFLSPRFQEILKAGKTRITIVESLDKDTLATYDFVTDTLLIPKRALDIGDDVALREFQYTLSHELCMLGRERRYLQNAAEFLKKVNGIHAKISATRWRNLSMKPSWKKLCFARNQVNWAI